MAAAGLFGSWRWGFAAWVALAGCNPFQTGEPDPPDGNQITYPAPTSTDNVLAIVSMALNGKDNRAYLDRLTSDFRFLPDPVQLQGDEFRTFPADWRLSIEEFALAGLFRNSDSVKVVWRSIFTQYRVNEAVVTADYDITVHVHSSPIRSFTGRAEFTMVQDAGFWRISEWRDFVESGNPNSWGLLRAQLLGSG